MKRPLVLLVLAACGPLGCHKKDVAAPPPPENAVLPEMAASDAAPDASAANAPSAARTQPAKPLPPPPATVSARAENYVLQSVAGEVDPSLSAQLRNFVQQKHRLPESFAEFATTRLDSIPRPPAGKKWVIDATDLQVKAVAAK
jgi:hypothetical protein